MCEIPETVPAKRWRIKISETTKLEAIQNNLPSTILGNFYLDETTADVYFVCGDEMKHVPAHRLILAKASTVFHNMFYGKNAEKLGANIKLPKISAETMKKLLQLIYLDVVDFRNTNIAEIIDLAGKYNISISRILYELKIAPEKDSPNHALNILNDVCTQELLRKLKTQNDYLNAAEVCSLFQNNAKLGFPSKFKCLEVKRKDEIESSLRSYELLPSKAKRFLNLFAPFVDKIKWNGMNNDDLKLIAKFCGNHLSELLIRNFDCDYDLDFNTPIRFKTLRKIDITSCLCSNVYNFGLHPELTTLLFFGEIKIDICRNFPKLKEVNFGCFEVDYFEFEENQLAEFLHLNPQLKRLEIEKSAFASAPHIFQQITMNGDNIESLSLDCQSLKYKTIPSDSLRKLKCLTINGDPKYISNTLQGLINSIAEHDIQLEQLHLAGEYNKNHDSMFLQEVIKLKYLKKFSVLDIQQTSLVNIVKNLKELEEIEIKCSNGKCLKQTSEIADIMENGKKLKKVTFGCHLIDMKYYNSVLSLATDRVKVTIKCHVCTVSKNVLDSNDEWLNIICTNNSLNRKYRR